MRKLILALTFFLLTAFHVVAFAIPQPVGTLHRDTILGVPCQIYLPHNYAKRINPEKRGFPCLYLQHGMFGCEDDWSRSGHLLQWIDSLNREEMIAEMIIVMPDNFLGSIPPEERAELMARPNVTPDGKPFEAKPYGQHHRKLTKDQEMAYEMSGYWESHFPQFMTEVERKYWIDTRSKHRAIAGLSMGGFHSMQVSHFITGEFDYIGLFSPVLFPMTKYTDLYSREGIDTLMHQTYDLEAQRLVYNGWEDDLRQMAQMPPYYYIAIGREDFLYEHVQGYRKWLEANNFEYVYYETDGGHTWKNWQDYLCHFLKACFTRIW